MRVAQKRRAGMCFDKRFDYNNYCCRMNAFNEGFTINQYFREKLRT